MGDTIEGSIQQQQSHYKIIILGAGFSGLGMAIQLKQAGEQDFVILEREAGVGGTWHVNRYPGCACDVQSHLYSFSFEPNPNWSRMFAPQQEIESYLQHCAEKYGLYSHIQCNTEIVSMRWQETDNCWLIKDGGAKEYRAKIVISGLGGLSTPAYPDIKGIEKFQGKTFHSQHWDHQYDLRNKRIAVIGTGASAIQFVPQIQPQASKLDLYQRTPVWIVSKPDRAIASLEKKLFRNFPPLQKVFRGLLYSILESRVFGFAFHPKLMNVVKALALRHLKNQVKDKMLRRRLTPSYTIGCKRILLSDDFYPAVSQSNVELVTDGIKEVTANGIITSDGTERKADVIIYGTGFRANDPIPPGMVFGRNGRDIAELWKDGPEAYKGTTVMGFPNFFMLMGPNTGLGHNSMIYMIESQIHYVLEAIRCMGQKQLATVEIKAEVQQEYNQLLQKKLTSAVWTAGGCQSWYLHANGKNVTLWPGFTWQFRRQTKHFDDQVYHVNPEPLLEVLTRQMQQPTSVSTTFAKETTE